MLEVRTREVPEQLVLSEKARVTAPEIPDFIGAAFGRLEEAARAYGEEHAANFVIYPEEITADKAGVIEACVPIRPDAEHSGDATVRFEPAHREAYVRLKKTQVRYPEIMSGYQAVEKWLSDTGTQMAGDPREVYFTDYMAAADDDEVCDIAFPIV